MILVFVHGWSVTHTETYGGLPEALAAQSGDLAIDVHHLWLGRYISFDDAVTMDDVVIGFDRALRDALAPQGGPLPEFSCITHSTGGPVAREWVRRYFGPAGLAEIPMRHLVMLAPANHGSPLAVLGKERVGRIQAWFSGVEPGERILEWLALGSAGQRALNRAWLDYDGPAQGVFPFVLTGQTIDRAFYDFLNSYLVEIGSDGVVRVACANLDATMLTLRETDDRVVNPHFSPPEACLLAPDAGVKRPRPAPLGVLPNTSHSGEKIGIMRSVRASDTAARPVVAEILNCLRVRSQPDYDACALRLAQLTASVQAADEHSNRHRYVNLVVSVSDARGDAIEDFDMYLLAGPTFDPAALPKGFFVDRQKNPDARNTLVYYLDYDVMTQVPQEMFGLRIRARPSNGFAHYAAVEFRVAESELAQILRPNETVYIDVILRRHVDTEIFRLDPGDAPRHSFKKAKPSGTDA